MRKRTLFIEVALLTIIGGAFLNSAQKFMSESDNKSNSSQNIDIKKADYSFAKPVSKEESTNFFQYKTKCLLKGESVTTTAPRIRITGELCGIPKFKRNPSSLMSNTLNKDKNNFKIMNESTNYNATVFSDLSKKTFSSDFIPLETGTNKISMLFEYENGTKIPIEVTVVRKK